MTDSELQLALFEVEAELETLVDPERAVGMAAYMKDHFVYLGVLAKPRRAISRSALNLAKQALAAELLDAVRWCWAQEPRELQYVGIDLMRAGAKNLRPDDLADLRVLVETKSWWDTVDSLAAHSVGRLVADNRELSAEMDHWVDSGNMWVARTAILHQLTWKAEAEPERLFDYAQRRAADREFFIRKALGWALRSLARVEPDQVREFVDLHRDELSGLTIREATKHL